MKAKLVTSFIFCLVSCTGATHVRAQVTDVAQKVSDALHAVGPVPVTRTIQVPRTLEVCQPSHREGYGACHEVTVFDQKQQTSNEILTASNIRVVASSPVLFDPLALTQLPDRVIVNDESIQDCTSTPATQQVSLSESFQRSESIAFSHSIQNTQSAEISFGLKLNEAFNLGGRISVGQSTTSGTVKTDGSTDTVTRTQTGSITVQPHANVMAELRVWAVHYTVPFHTTAVLDADLSPNDKGYRHLSDVLNGPGRTFDINGEIEADDASEGRLVFYDLPYIPADCQPSQPVVVQKGYVPKSGVKLRARPD